MKRLRMDVVVVAVDAADFAVAVDGEETRPA